MILRVCAQFYILCLLFLLTVDASAQTLKTGSEGERVIYVISEQWHGFSHPDGTGLYFDLFKKIYGTEGVNVISKIQPVLRGVASINKGELADVMLAEWHLNHLGVSDQYHPDKIVYPQMPIYAEYVEAVYRPDSQLSWRKLLANKNFKVAWVRGYGYGEVLGVAGHKVTYLNSAEQGLKMLSHGNIDSYINDRQEINLDLAREPFKGIVWRKELVLMRKLYPVFHNNERGRTYAAIYDRRMAEMQASGELYRFYQSYGESYEDVVADEIDYQLPIKD